MTGAVVVYTAALVLTGYALTRRDAAFSAGLRRASAEFVKLVPRLVCAVLAAGFMAKLLPADAIGRFLGAEAGFKGIAVGSAAGLLVPSGPMISFAIAAALADHGASVPALVSFISGWSVFAAHRIFIFEIPLVGVSFVRLRLLSVVALPPIAGLFAMLLLKVRELTTG